MKNLSGLLSHFYPRLIVFVISILLIPTGCRKARKTFGDAINDGINEFRLLREDAIFEIDKSINLIENGLYSATEAVDELGEQIDETVQKVLVYNVPFIIKKLSAEIAVLEFCSVDFLKNRSLYYLRTMKAELIDGELPPVPNPTICFSSLINNAIDLNDDRNPRTVITFTGYDMLSREEDIKAFFVSKNKEQEIEPIYVRPQTDYTFTVNLSSYLDEFIDDWKYFEVRYKDVPLFSASIIPKVILPPKTETVEVGIGNFAGFQPPHVRGDREFKGHGPRLYLSCRIYQSWSKVNATFYMEAEETKSDWTTCRGTTRRHPVYTPPEGWHIKEILSPTFYTLVENAVDEDIREDVFNGVLGQVTLMGDTGGNDCESGTGIESIKQGSYKFKIVIEEDY